MRFRTQTLLERRRLEEERALREMAGAAKDRARAEEHQQRLDHAVAEARERCHAIPAAGKQECLTAAKGQATDRFRARLAEAAIQAAEHARTHRDGALASAVAAETAARALHDNARQKRELLERLRARAETTERQEAERRGEHSAGEAAASSGWRRQ